MSPDSAQIAPSALVLISAPVFQNDGYCSAVPDMDLGACCSKGHVTTVGQAHGLAFPSLAIAAWDAGSFEGEPD